MNRIIKKSLLVLAIFATLASCTDGGYIGDLLNQWELKEMTYKGETTKPESRIYLRFQGLHVEASGIQGCYVRNGDEMVARFYYPINVVKSCLEPYKFYDDPTIPYNDDDKLFGADTTKIVRIKFHVEKLTSDDLILSNDDGRWVFEAW